jgi:diacylglycerol kinase family enzyme
VKVLLVVNSSASSVTARTRVIIQKALSADHDITVAETSRRGHASRLARGAAATGTELVVVLGGDGTLNEAANGLAGTQCALAALPGGSTNVFARSIGTPDDPVEATARVLESIRDDGIKRIGLGSVNGRYFLFHAGLGFDAAVVAEVEKRSGLKRYAGHPLFIWAGLTTWVRHYDRTRPRMSIIHADGTVIDDVYLAIILNTDPYTYLGSRPLSIAPDATLDRPLTSVAVRTLSFRPLIKLLNGLIRGSDDIRTHKKVDYRTDVFDLRVTGHGPFPYQVDGDYLGDTEDLTFTWRPDVLSLVVPTKRG